MYPKYAWIFSRIKYNHIHRNVSISDEREEKDMMREREGENG